MIFKRGIFFGLVLILNSINYILKCAIQGVRLEIYILCVLGIIQIWASFRFQKDYKRKVLKLCFGVEGIYYVIAMVYLLINNLVLPVKVIGCIVGIFMLMISFVSIKDIHSMR